MVDVVARLRWFFALLPVFPPLSLASFYFLRYWRVLNKTTRGVLVFYIFSQVLAAIFTPEPVLSLILGMARALFIVALVIMGASLRDKSALYYLLIGISVVLLMALATTYAAFGPHFYSRRLIHPYYTEAALGIAGALGVWILLDWQGSWRLRLPLLLLALGGLMFAGSRGAIGAMLVGLLAAVPLKNLRYLWALLVAAVFLVFRYGLLWLGGWTPELHRMFSLQLSGRDKIWKHAWKAVVTHPWGGVGPYQLGPWLDYRNGNFALWEGASALGFHFPAWAKKLDGAWLIAHDIFLHSLGESGVIGTLGFLALLGLIGYAVIRARDPLLAAIFFGYLVMGLVDNPIAVPSLFFAEVFWVAGGMALAQAGLAVPLEQSLAVDDDQLGPDPL